ncbi:mitochondrial acyl carrier protein [Microbotryomycetes sp. JL201]|nr:mitochondrial acyl carrier protein [Microbotryomycetes sp. JL201]
MFRLAAARTLTSVAAPRVVAQRLPIAVRAAPRWYSAAAGLDKTAIQSRIFEVLQSFEKVDSTKVSPTASFTNDLGLDSLDAVEVVMAIEEEFSIEIPDEEADKITTVAEAIEYISKSPEAH